MPWRLLKPSSRPSAKKNKINQAVVGGHLRYEEIQPCKT